MRSGSRGDAGDESLVRLPDAALDFDSNLVSSVDGLPFTGVGYEDVPSRGLSEVTYRNGLQDGPARDWYPSGALKGESQFRENVLHGVLRELGPDGTVLLESRYEYGILISSVQRDVSGNVIESFEIDRAWANFALLERCRREKAWPT
jgi:hypothetical protein